jgi:hypothetical protein
MNNDLFRITAGQFQLIPSNEGRLLGGPTVQTNKSKNHKLQFLAKYLWLFVLFACSCSSIQLGSGKNQTRFEFGLIGDLPYSAEDEKKFPNLIEDINKADLAFVVHDGDFQADFRGYRDGFLPCSDETFSDRKNLAQSFKHPFIITPGDNDWTDCHYVKTAKFDPIERLTKFRELFFSGNQSLGQQTLSVTHQSSDPKYSKFVENLRWTYGSILFVTLHLVGSDNNTGRTTDMDSEAVERNTADLAWISENFELARRSENKAIVIITQANPGFPNSWPEARVRRYLLNSPIKLPEKKTKTAYDDFIRVLESETLRFTKPVLLVHGDSHIFRIDKPLLNSKTARVIENFTRLETFGTPDVHWIRVTADLNDPNVFTFKPEVVTKNVIDHTEK